MILFKAILYIPPATLIKTF